MYKEQNSFHSRFIPTLDTSTQLSIGAVCRGKAKSHATGAEAHEYELNLELNGPVDPEQSKISVTPRHVVLVIAKKVGSEGYWPRLSKEAGRQLHIKVWTPSSETRTRMWQSSFHSLGYQTSAAYRLLSS